MPRKSASSSSASAEHQVWGNVEGNSSTSSDSQKADGHDPRFKRFHDKRTPDVSSVTFNSSDSSSGPLEVPNEADSPSQGPMKRPDFRKGGGWDAAAKADTSLPSSSSAACAYPQARATATAVEQDDEVRDPTQRQPSWSEGAVDHAAGTCKPCAWKWKPRGCVQGANCVFCHLCDLDAHREYKKGRLVGLKANRLKRKNKGYEAAAPKTGEVEKMLPHFKRFSL